MAAVLALDSVQGAAGVNQVRVRVPIDIAPGTAVAVRLTYADRSSNEVTMAIR